MDCRWWAPALWLCLGCGSQVDGGGSDSTGADGSGGVQTEPTTTPPTGETGSGGPQESTGPEQLPEVCEAFFDEELRETAGTVVEIHNASAMSLLLETNCGQDYLRIENASQWRWPSGFCADTCQEQFEYGCSSCDGCATGSFRVVGPGASIELEWAGDLYETATPPTRCHTGGGACGAQTCRVERNATEGEALTVRVAGLWQSDCELVAADPAACSCPDGTSCDTYVDGEGIVATSSFEVSAVFGGGTVVVDVMEG